MSATKIFRSRGRLAAVAVIVAFLAGASGARAQGDEETAAATGAAVDAPQPQDPQTAPAQDNAGETAAEGAPASDDEPVEESPPDSPPADDPAAAGDAEAAEDQAPTESPSAPADPAEAESSEAPEDAAATKAPEDPAEAAVLAAAARGGLGAAHWPADCAESAQALVDTGLVALHAGHAQAARAAFRGSRKADPECVYAMIGEALTHAVRAQDADALAAGRAALQDAAAQARSRLQSAWVEALEAYFAGDGRSTGLRLAALRERLRRLDEDLPEDDEIALLYAQSLLGAAPRAGVAPEDAPARQAAALAQAVHARAPRHAGAARTLMQARAAQGDALGALAAAQAWAEAAPESGRAPLAVAERAARLGLYETAQAHAETAAQRARDQGLARLEADALAVQVDAALQTCGFDTARAVVERLAEIGPDAEPARTAARAALLLETGAWAEAADFEPPAEPPLARALALHAKVLGHVRLGEDESALQDGATLAALKGVEPEQASALHALQASAHAAVLSLGESAERALAAYDNAAGIAPAAVPGLRPALSARVLKGDFLRALKLPREALDAYDEALAREPNRRAALLGAAAAADALGEGERADAYRSRLTPACAAQAEAPGR